MKKTMTYEESKRLLNYPQYASRKIEDEKYRLKDLERRIIDGGGGYKDTTELGTVVSGGKRKLVYEKLSDLEDLRIACKKKIIHLEKVKEKIKSLIECIYKTNPNVRECEEEKVKRIEILLIERYILELKSLTIMNNLSISSSQFYRDLNQGFSLFYNVVKDLDFKGIINL